MALTHAVTKQNVQLTQPKMWRFSVTLVTSDDGDGPGFTRPFSADYKKESSPEDMDARMAKIEAGLLAEMQEAIVQYEGERAKFDHPKFTNLVARLNTALTGGA